MGYYIPGPAKGKAGFIIDQYGGRLLDGPPASFSEIPAGQALIVVVDNTYFEAAAYAYSPGEFDVFTSPDEIRPRQYLLVAQEIADRESGRKPRVHNQES